MCSAFIVPADSGNRFTDRWVIWTRREPAGYHNGLGERLSCSLARCCCPSSPHHSEEEGWMEVLQLLGRKGQPPAPSNPNKGITHPNSRSGMWQHWQIRICSPTICLDPRFHFSLLERLGLAANIRCRHRFGTSPSPFLLPQTPRF